MENQNWFSKVDFHTFSIGFLQELGYQSPRKLLSENLTLDILHSTFGLVREFDPDKLLVKDWSSFYLLFQLTNADLFPNKTIRMPVSAGDWNSYLFFALELKGGRHAYSKSHLEAIAVELNRAFLIPIFLLIKHGPVLSLVITSRRASKRDPGRDVIEKVFSVIGLDLQHPVKRDREILEKISLDYIKRVHHVASLAELHEYWATFFDAVPMEKVEVEHQIDELDLVEIYFSDLANYPLPTEEEKLYDGLTVNPVHTALPLRDRKLWSLNSLEEFYTRLLRMIPLAITELGGYFKEIRQFDLPEWVASIQSLKGKPNVVAESLRNLIAHFSQLQDENTYASLIRLISSIYLLPPEIAALLPEDMMFPEFADALLADNSILQREYVRICDISARSRGHLIQSNLRLAISRARKKYISGEDILDLIQAGNTGLMRAAELFDISKKAQFSTYATIWIDQRISRYLADHSRLIRLPVHTHDELLRIFRTRNQLLNRDGCDPSNLTLALELDLLPSDLKSQLIENNLDCSCLSFQEKETLKKTLIKIRELMLISRPVVSLERRVGRGDLTLGETIPDESHQKMIRDLDCALLRCALEKLLEPLGERNMRILKLRYGYLDNHDYTLEEIAQDQGVTRERIRQIESLCLNKLKKACRVLAASEGISY